MPKQGGQGKGKPKLKDRGVGKALIRQKIQMMNNINGKKDKEMKSILENSALEDFLNTTEMDGGAVEVRRVHQNHSFLLEPTMHQTLADLNIEQFKHKHLVIPRKPAWTRTMTAEEVDRNEKNAFLEWRRGIAALQSANDYNLKMTPFEKNLEVWRQLWRVCERSNYLVQIVDGRNPLLYYTADLMKYASQMTPSRPMILLINKADFLTDYQRLCWSKHLYSLGIRFAFYSARNEQERLDQGDFSTAEVDEDAINQLVEDFVDQWQYHGGTPHPTNPVPNKSINQETERKGDFVWGDFKENSVETSEQEEEESPEDTIDTGNNDLKPTSTLKEERGIRILSRGELMFLLEQLPKRLNLLNVQQQEEQDQEGGSQALDGSQAHQPQEQRVCVGMVGYPNVGKSSVINSLLGVSKSTHGVTRVAVSSTPGKTKHFQTLLLADTSLLLCDCPGLVFPSVMRSTGEMLCAGILPIDQMRDHLEAAAVIAERIPVHLLESVCGGMTIQKEVTSTTTTARAEQDSELRRADASAMLSAYCSLKGYITNGTGRWDEFRACKELLKAFNDGKLLSVAQPPFEVNLDNFTSSSGATVERVLKEREKAEVAFRLEETRMWFRETEKVLMRREAVADRIVMRRLKYQQEKEEKEKMNSGNNSGVNNSGLTKGNLASLGEHVTTQGRVDEKGEKGDNEEEEVEEIDGVVFGAHGSDYWEQQLREVEGADEEVQEGEYEFIPDDDSDVDSGGESELQSQTTAGGGKTPREHKRQKYWGKKNKKLRNKNPYAEEEGVASFKVLSKNRHNVVGVGAVGDRRSETKRSQKQQQHKEKAFVRTTVPYQQAGAL